MKSIDFPNYDTVFDCRELYTMAWHLSFSLARAVVAFWHSPCPVIFVIKRKKERKNIYIQKKKKQKKKKNLVSICYTSSSLSRHILFNSEKAEKLQKQPNVYTECFFSVS